MMTADAERRGLSLERTLMTFEIVSRFRLAKRRKTRWCMARARPILFAMRRLVGTA